MNKQFTHNGIQFNIKVELNTSIEKHIGGKRLHTITVNSMNTNNYYKQYNVESYELEKEIVIVTDLAKQFADNLNEKNKSEEELILEKLGFK